MVEEGVFFESVNFAVVRKLPVLFVCENNLYSVYSPLAVRQPMGRSIAAMVAGLGIETHAADGNDAPGVYELTAKAVHTIRSEQRPMFLEFATYRWREHCGPNFDNHIGYRTEAEYAEWKALDPIARLTTTMQGTGGLTADGLNDLETAIQAEVDDAFAYAEGSPFPAPAALYDHVTSDTK